MGLGFTVRCVLMDVEGTTSSISFVHKVMFPYARERLDQFLARRWYESDVQHCVALIAADAGGLLDVVQDLPDEEARPLVVAHLRFLMDHDAKSTGLKRLQGMIWEAGFQSGELVAHVYPDVPLALRAWQATGLDLRIYSSGSVQAQRLFFGHTVAGNLLPLLSGHYDTTSGPKREAGSYLAIASGTRFQPGDFLFLSDIPAELDAALAAGFQTCLVDRPGNGEVEATPHRRIASFAQLDLHRLSD